MKKQNRESYEVVPFLETDLENKSRRTKVL
jgi:hypothetical protein